MSSTESHENSLEKETLKEKSEEKISDSSNLPSSTDSNTSTENEVKISEPSNPSSSDIAVNVDSKDLADTPKLASPQNQPIKKEKFRQKSNENLSSWLDFVRERTVKITFKIESLQKELDTLLLLEQELDKEVEFSSVKDSSTDLDGKSNSVKEKIKELKSNILHLDEVKTDYLESIFDCKIRNAFTLPRSYEIDYYPESWFESTSVGKQVLAYEAIQMCDGASFLSELIENIYRDFSIDLPWISIITPSGTGKTQLPFSLQYPSLFVCLKAHRKNAQEIYKPQKKVALKIENLFRLDFRRYKFIEKYKIDPLASFTDRIDEANPLTLHSPDKSFISCFANFTLFMIKHLKDSPLPWIKKQFKEKFDWKDAEHFTLEEIALELSELFPPGTRRPVFFIDECTVINDLDYVRFAAHILTLIGIIPVFMGTNPEIPIVPKTSKIILESQEVKIPSCIAISRLSATSKDQLQSMKEIILQDKLFSSSEASSKLKSQIEFLYQKILPLERPSIAMQVHEWMVNHMSNLSKQEDPIVRALNIKDIKALCSEIVDTFIKSAISYSSFGPQPMYSTKMTTKSHVPNGPQDFNKGQIGFCLAEISRNFSSGTFLSSINRHIAYLRVPEEGPRTFGNWTLPEGSFVLKPANQTFDARNLKKDPKVEYHLLDNPIEFPKFDQEPLTGFIFSGGLNFSDMFKDLQLKYSAIQAMSKFIEEIEGKDTKLDAKSLEFTCCLALLSASRSIHRTFSSWFPKFIHGLKLSTRKLSIFYDSKDLVLKRLFSSELPTLCTPNSTWNSDFASFLSEFVPLGTLHYICKESDQYCLQVRTKDNLVCNIEMNFKQKNLEVRCIQKYLRRSAKNECPLEIIIGNSFVKGFETANFQSKDCNIYALVRSQKQKKNSKDKKPKIEFKLIKCFDSNSFNLDSTTSVDIKKTVILISLNEINPAFTKSRLMNWECLSNGGNKN